MSRRPPGPFSAFPRPSVAFLRPYAALRRNMLDHNVSDTIFWDKIWVRLGDSLNWVSIEMTTVGVVDTVWAPNGDRPKKVSTNLRGHHLGPKPCPRRRLWPFLGPSYGADLSDVPKH